MEDFYNESDLDMTEVWSPVPSTTRETSAADPGAGVGRGCGRQATPRHHRSPRGGPIPVTSTATVAAVAATTTTPTVTAARVTTAGTFPLLWGDLRRTWRFSASSPHCKADA